MGFTYILSNKAMPDLYKIGYTERSVYCRVNELNDTTSLPLPFNIEYSYQCNNAFELEQKAHLHFKDYRINSYREFFKVPLSEIIQFFEDINEGYGEVTEQEPDSFAEYKELYHKIKADFEDMRFKRDILATEVDNLEDKVSELESELKEITFLYDELEASLT